MPEKYFVYRPSPRRHPEDGVAATEQERSAESHDIRDYFVAAKRSFNVSYPKVPIDPEREIRVVRLLPGEPEDEICCELERRTLPSDDDVSNDEEEDGKNYYEALSYTWGGRNIFGQITLNGQKGFPVTYNLSLALKRLRTSHLARVLWVDQLSIDQEAVDEKNKHVKLMGQIFHRAAWVLIWLGELPESVIASDLRDNHPGEDESERKAMFLKWIKYSIDNTAPSWPSRTWILQEFAMARKQPMVFCGNTLNPWEEFMRVIDAGREDADQATQQLVKRFWAIEYLRHPDETRNFLQLAWTINQAQCSVPKDKVFALLSLLPPAQKALITVDYGSTDATVFAEATCSEIAISKSLMIMALAGSRPRRACEVPTWAVDFSAPFALGLPDPKSAPDWTASLTDAERDDDRVSPDLLRTVTRSFAELANAPSAWCQRQDETTAITSCDLAVMQLTIRGLEFDTVSSLYLDDRPLCVMEEHIRLSVRYSRPVDNNYSPCYCDLLDMAYERLRTGEKANKSTIDECSSCGHKFDAKRHVKHVVDWEEKLDNRDGDPGRGFVSYLHLFDHNCSPFSTAYGFLGLGPRGMQAGDRIVLPYGSRFPMALRPSDHDDGSFVFLGNVCVYGIMTGELRHRLSELEMIERDFVLR